MFKGLGNYFLCALFISVFFNYFLRPIATHLGLIDSPGGRKTHANATPTIGGVAMFISFAFTLLALPISLAPFRSLIAGSFMLIIVGVLDDLHEVKPYFRLVGQAIASIVMIFWGGLFISNLDNCFKLGALPLSWLSIPFTLLVSLATINAVNMLDGLDGLLSGLIFINFLSLFSIVFSATHHAEALIISVILAAILGFLFFNFPYSKRYCAKIFMGDAGSMFLGFLLIWFIIYLNNKINLSISIILWILAIPIFDIINVCIRRIYLKKNLVFASRDHIHHFMRHYGFSSSTAVYIILGLTILSNMIGLMGYFYHLPDNILFYVFSSIFCLASILYQIKWLHFKENP